MTKYSDDLLRDAEMLELQEVEAKKSEDAILEEKLHQQTAEAWREYHKQWTEEQNRD